VEKLPVTDPRLTDTARSSAAHTRKIIPNRNTIAVKPYKHVEMTKSEMYEMLRKAVENTK
jgi:hypothetical protein